MQILQDNGYAKARFMKPEEMVGLTDLEKLVGGKKAFTALLGGLVDKARPKPTLVPESDKRDEWVPDGDADSDFGEAAPCGADLDFAS